MVQTLAEHEIRLTFDSFYARESATLLFECVVATDPGSHDALDNGTFQFAFEIPHGRVLVPLKMHEQTIDGITFSVNLLFADGTPRISLQAQLADPRWFQYCFARVGIDEVHIWKEFAADTDVGSMLNVNFTSAGHRHQLTFDSFYSKESDTIHFECLVHNLTFEFALQPEKGGHSFEALIAAATSTAVDGVVMNRILPATGKAAATTTAVDGAVTVAFAWVVALATALVW